MKYGPTGSVRLFSIVFSNLGGPEVRVRCSGLQDRCGYERSSTLILWTSSTILDILKMFPNNSFLNTLMGNNLIVLGYPKEGLDFIKKGSGFIELNNDTVKII